MNYAPPIKIFIRRDDIWGDNFHVRMGSLVGERMVIAQPVQFISTTEAPVVETQPALTLSKESAQSFMDELWNVGIRPSEGTGSAGQLAATQKHLDDMRRLVFEEPKVEHRMEIRRPS